MSTFPVFVQLCIILRGLIIKMQGNITVSIFVNKKKTNLRLNVNYDAKSVFINMYVHIHRYMKRPLRPSAFHNSLMSVELANQVANCY